MPPALRDAGDLLSALLLAWLQRYPEDMARAVEAAVAGLQAVLQATARECGPAAMTKERSAAVCAARELRLVQNQHLLVEPPVSLRCEPAGSST